MVRVPFFIFAPLSSFCPVCRCVVRLCICLSVCLSLVPFPLPSPFGIFFLLSLLLPFLRQSGYYALECECYSVYEVVLALLSLFQHTDAHIVYIHSTFVSLYDFLFTGSPLRLHTSSLSSKQYYIWHRHRCHQKTVALQAGRRAEAKVTHPSTKHKPRKREREKKL